MQERGSIRKRGAREFGGEFASEFASEFSPTVGNTGQHDDEDWRDV